MAATRRTRLLPLPAACVAVLALLAPPSPGAKIVVKKGGPISTIQDGIDQAGPGDKVIVKKGVYEEAVTIPAGKDGLQLLAKGKVVIDPLSPGGLGLGPALTILSQNVRVRGFTIQDAEPENLGSAPGDGISVQAPGAAIEKCRVFSTGSRGIVLINAPGSRVEKCSIFSSNQEGVRAVGDDIVIRKTKVDRIEDDGIVVIGARALVEKCRVRGIDDDGITVVGDDAVVRKNRVEHVDDDGIRVDGANAQVVKNRLTNADGDGVTLTGDGASAEKNRCRVIGGFAYRFSGDSITATKNRGDAVEGGIDVFGNQALVEKNEVRRCFGSAAVRVDGLQPTVRDNVCRDIAEATAAIWIFSAQSGLVEGNEVRRANATGILVDASVSGLVVHENEVRDSGASDDAGFRIEGVGCQVDQNVASRIGGDGFLVLADGVTLTGNLARDCSIDGFDVEAGDAVTLDGNTAKKNGAEGLENNGTNTVITNNTAKNNRIDFASDGTVATFTGNAFADGSDTTTAPEID